MDTPYQNRLCLNDTRPGYVEARAKQFQSTEVRECPLMAVYLNVYCIEDHQHQQRFRRVDIDAVAVAPEDGDLVGVHHVDLDRIFG